jgi:type I restriction-modification system DNA methylase subunit
MRYGSGQHVRKIIKCLENVTSVTGHRASVVYFDWIKLVEAALIALPDQLKAMVTTGQFKPDPPETVKLFQDIESRYQHNCYGSFEEQVWRDGFCRAFALLLEAAAPGLWGPGSYSDFDIGYMGPDILGHIYMAWAGANPDQGSYYTPWNVCLLMAQMSNPPGHGEREIHDRLKAALCHPDNILGAAVLMAGLVIPDDESGAHRDWFFNRMVPAAMSHFEPIRVSDPCCGSGVMLLAQASTWPAWAIHLGLVQFYGQDIDPVACAIARANCMIYGLNSYGLKLEAALAEAQITRQQQTEDDRVLTFQPPGKVVKNVCRNGAATLTNNGDNPSPSFEEMFRAALAAPETIPVQSA